MFRALEGMGGEEKLFDDAAAYYVRLMTLQGSNSEAVSIDDMLSLLDA